MIHRGVQYARAVKLYYRKYGSYPTSIEQLENTNKIRYLRKRYKDPMSPDGMADCSSHRYKTEGADGGGRSAIRQPASAGPTGGSGTATAQQPSRRNRSSRHRSGRNADGTSTGTGTGSTADQGSTGTGPTTGGATGPMEQARARRRPHARSGQQVQGRGNSLLQRQDNYNEWFFIYEPTQDKARAC